LEHGGKEEEEEEDQAFVERGVKAWAGGACGRGSGEGGLVGDWGEERG